MERGAKAIGGQAGISWSGQGGPGITIVIMTSMVTELSSGPVTPE